MSRPQVGGDHYRTGGLEPIDYIMANRLPFCEGNVVKYVTRHRHKGGAEDIRKAMQYLQFILEKEYGIKDYTQEYSHPTRGVGNVIRRTY